MIEASYIFLEVVLKTLFEEYEMMGVVHHQSPTWAPFVHFKFDTQKVYMCKITCNANFDLENQTNIIIVLVAPAE